MTCSDLHTHTHYCDGKNTPEEMVLSAIAKGLDIIGLCVHSFTDFDQSYCVKKEDVKKFQDEVNALKVKYASKIKVLCGVEQDYFSNHPLTGFDYAIGSVHYFYVDGKFYDVDNNPEKFVETVHTAFGGDFYTAVENYYSFVGNVIEKTNADIIGHFDLITKFNENDKLFSTSHPRYIEAVNSALDKLIKTDKPFEINTGAISRGYRTQPYPSNDIIKIIKEKGGKFVLNSDSHNVQNIAYQFDVWEKLL